MIRLFNFRIAKIEHLILSYKIFFQKQNYINKFLLIIIDIINIILLKA